MNQFPLKIPTYNSKTEEWSTTIFDDKESFIEYVESQVKYPGKYNLTNTHLWQKVVVDYYKNGEDYTLLIPETIQEIKWWEKEKEKVVNGVIYDNIYVPPFYYWYLNFCPIYDKVKKKIDFAQPWDSDLHFFYYILLCILKGRHAVVVKCRQRGYTFKIMSILMWSYWWAGGSVNTIGASDEEFTQKSWEFMNLYRNHVNSKTPWIRGPQIANNLAWLERSMTEDGTFVGNNSKMTGLTFKQSPSKGVGGAQTLFFYEEAGIAPTLLITLGYIRPAVEQGNVVTGTIIISGSVGELEQCRDLEKIFRYPDKYGFMSVSNTFDQDSKLTECGFFVPHSWNLEGYMDNNGNSLIDLAEEFIKQDRKKSEGISFEDAQLAISQNPLTFEEAFGVRKRSYFRSALIKKQQDRLSAQKPKITPVVLYEAENRGTIKWRLADRQDDPKPLIDFPLREDVRDVRGCVEIVEFPISDKPSFLTYYAGVDPIAVDRTTTSESLFSIHIFKTFTEEKDLDSEGNVQIKVDGYKPVAWYVGRMEDLKETNTIGEYLVRMYNAFTICESNVQSFINHMQERKLQHLLATKKEIGFLDDLKANTNVHKQYGVHMTPLIKNYLLQNVKEYTEEEIDVIRKPDGEVARTVYGVERILHNRLLDELRKFTEDLNTDSLISFSLAQSLAKYHFVNGLFNRVDKTKEKRDKNMIAVVPPKSYFKNAGYFQNNDGISMLPKRSYFKSY